MKRSIVVLIGLVVLAFQGIAFGQQQLPPEVIHYADVIVTNGVIYSADEQFSRYEAMAVRDGRILALGSSDVISRMAGPNTRRIELQPGQSVLPGLMNTHAHGPIGTGSGTGAVRGSVTFDTIEGGLREVEQLVSKAAEGEWVTASGPRNSIPLQIVTRWQLDTVSPNNPLLISYGGENGVANSKAWEAVGLTSDVPGAMKVEDLIRLGLIRADDMPDALKNIEEGEAIGQLRTWAYGAITYGIPWNPVTEDDLVSRTSRLFRLNALGNTTVGGRASGRGITIIRELWERDELTIRVRVSHMFLRSNPRGEEYLKRMGKLVSFGLGDMVRIIGATTQHADGTNGSGAMLTFQPKLRRLDGDPFGEYGENRWEVEGNDRENVILGIRYGWNINGVHNQGDRATNLWLKAIEAGYKDVLVKPSLPSGTDHQVLVTQENLDLMKRYNVWPSLDLKYVFSGPSPEGLIYQYGADSVNEMSQVRRFIDAGLRPSNEGDDALLGIEEMITRTDGSGRVWGDDQKLTRQEALWTKTLWSAGYIGEQDQLGSLEVGKLGDFVVLGEDYLRVPENEISQIPVLLTVVGGKVVYDRERDGVPEPARGPAF